MRLKIIPVTNESPRVKRSTRQSIRRSKSSAISVGSLIELIARLVQLATSKPTAPPAQESIILSVSSCLTSLGLLAPTASRIPISFRRSVPRARRRLARFTQARKRTSAPTTASNPEKVKISARDVMTELRKGSPAIELNPSTGRRSGASAGIVTDENTIVVGVWMLQPGEETVVGKRLKEVLGKAVKA